MRILSGQHSATSLPAATVDDDVGPKSPVLTISTIASPDHQPSQASVVAALLPPVPPLTSSPVMSLLNKAANSNSTTKKSMFSDLMGSGDASATSLFGDNKTSGYTGFLSKSQVEPRNMLDYSQYLKDSNIDLERNNLEDLNGKFSIVFLHTPKNKRNVSSR